MREIKFRAWLPYDEGEDPRGEMFPHERILPMDGWDDWWINLSEVHPGYDGVFHPSKGDILLMQFTGLKDKNGVEIYEGDIAKRYTKVGVVKYGEHITADPHYYGGYTIGFYLDTGTEEKDILLDTEVIGNIYENPELIK